MMDAIGKEHLLRINQKTPELIGIPIPGIFPDQSVPESSGYANYTGYSDPIVYPGPAKAA